MEAFVAGAPPALDRAPATPARAAGHRGPDGCLHLGGAGLDWRDGAEADVRALLQPVRDRSDLSDELAGAVHSWATRCHFGRERGHVLRPLAIAPGARVLEVGAGCGPVSRSLAERGLVVDALEPDPARAAIARQRLAGLPGAEVLVGTPDDLPDVPAYDVAVLVGVLEYVGGADAGPARTEFLRRLARRVRPGGHIVCAIENRFGVAYLTGQPEEHTGRQFDGLEGYPGAPPVRTFGRADLSRLFADAGLKPTVLHVMPEYRFARLVFSDALLEGPARDLSWRVPVFPTETHLPRARLADEGRLWRGLVEDGLGGHFANAFLVVAGVDGEQRLWDDGLEAAFYSYSRRALWATETRVHTAGDDRLLERRLLRPDPERAARERLEHRASVTPFVPGPTLTETLAACPPEEIPGWMGRWRALVRAELKRDPAGPFDLWSENVIVAGEGLVAVDTEFVHRDYGEREIVERCLLWTASALADRTPASRWPGETVGAVLDQLAHAAGAGPVDTSALAAREAALDAELLGGPPGSPEHRRLAAVAEAAITARLALPLEACALGQRDVGPGGSLEAARAHAEGLALALAADPGGDAARRIAELEQALAAVAGSRSWRL
ncbi:MAG: class I SAM-dependent methyltransferase, partial [Solirubrobacteraceae bacterium]